MTKLLEQAIARARELTDQEQDELARTLLAIIEDSSAYPMDKATRMAIEEGLAQAERGEFVPEEEIEALWRRHGL